MTEDFEDISVERETHLIWARIDDFGGLKVRHERWSWGESMEND